MMSLEIRIAIFSGVVVTRKASDGILNQTIGTANIVSGGSSDWVWMWWGVLLFPDTLNPNSNTYSLLDGIPGLDGIPDLDGIHWAEVSPGKKNPTSLGFNPTQPHIFGWGRGGRGGVGHSLPTLGMWQLGAAPALPFCPQLCVWCNIHLSWSWQELGVLTGTRSHKSLFAGSSSPCSSGMPGMDPSLLSVPHMQAEQTPRITPCLPKSTTWQQQEAWKSLQLIPVSLQGALPQSGLTELWQMTWGFSLNAAELLTCSLQTFPVRPHHKLLQ